jgi:molecular chaperone DnaK (HSP70)
LGLTSQRDNADIRQLIDRTYKSFSSSLESIDKTVVSQSNSIRKELSETREKLQEDTQSLKAQIFDELEKRFSMLKDAKLSRNDMADILFELGLRIKKAEFTPELKDATNSNGSDGVLLIEASQVTE